MGARDDDTKVGHDYLFQGDGLKIQWRDTDDITRSFGPIVLTIDVNPKQIAFFNDEKPFAQSGIYRLEKDRLEICWRIDNREGKGEAPRKFEADKDTKTIQLVQSLNESTRPVRAKYPLRRRDCLICKKRSSSHYRRSLAAWKANFRREGIQKRLSSKRREI